MKLELGFGGATVLRNEFLDIAQSGHSGKLKFDKRSKRMTTIVADFRVWAGKS
ncbi:hypothetical protein [Actinophytocola sp.]|uniref:hypothetical protein n=1 Tax=Actinophytocola sp. TaxID=1872138 RepID=UPI00389A8AE9